MSWQCRFVSDPPRRSDDGRVDYMRMPVGSMWFYDIAEQAWPQCHLTAWYWARNARRAPLCVLLPGPTYFLIDGQCFDRKRGGYYDGWKVTGRTPVITVKPSIHIEGQYHGHLTNGVIGRDVDGRRFDQNGIREKT